ALGAADECSPLPAQLDHDGGDGLGRLRRGGRERRVERSSVLLAPVGCRTLVSDERGERLGAGQGTDLGTQRVQLRLLKGVDGAQQLHQSDRLRVAEGRLDGRVDPVGYPAELHSASSELAGDLLCGALIATERRWVPAGVALAQLTHATPQL